MKKSLFLLLFAMFLTLSSVGQLSWSKKEHDFGSSQKNVPMAYRFQYINYSANPVTINFMKSSSYCLIPKWTTAVVQPNEQGSILITYTPSRDGHYNETLKIFLDNNSYPQELFVIGVVGDGDFKNTNQPALTGYQPKLNRVETANLSTASIPIESPVPNKLNTETVPNRTVRPAVVEVTTSPQLKPINRDLTLTSNNTGKLETAIAPNYIGSENLNTAVNERYLSYREKAMIKEINLIRFNPQAYIAVVEEYVRYMKADNLNGDFYKDEISVAQELIMELKNTPTLSILKPSEGIYRGAKIHGDAAKIHGSVDHQGQDGSFPWDRVKKYDKSMADGGENIVGGLSDIRKAVLILLIDSGIKGRGHRAALLYSGWTHVACYEVGEVGDMPYVWLQNFGQERENGISTIPAKSEESIPPSEPSLPVPSSYADENYDVDIRTKPGKYNNTNSSVGNIPDKPKKNPSNNNSSISTDYTPESAVEPLKSTSINSPTVSNPPATTTVGTNNLAVNMIPPKKAYTAQKATYMSNREQEMIAEINFLRMNPKDYATVIEAYITFMEMEIIKDESAGIFFNKEIKSAKELLELLDKIQPLSPLNPHEGMYVGAKVHAEYGKSSGNLEKEGSDGSMPNNRILKYAKDIINGDENLPRGTSNIRYSIIKLLIDKDDYNRTQRKILLNPNWDYIAIYEVGKVGNMHYWVQDFGQAKPEAKPMFDEEIEMENTGDKDLFGYAESKTYTETIISTEIQPEANVLNINKAFYLSTREQMFLREINFLRSNPKEYVTIMNSYIRILEKKKQENPNHATNYEQRIEAATFIKNELIKTNSVRILQPNQNIYQAAYLHGQDCKKSSTLTHWGSDETNTWQRLLKELPTIKDGDQCLIGDADDVRESVLNVLIDHAIFNRNQEIILLKPNWTIFGITEVGTVGKRKNCWVITLGEL
jgi:uncharacterized protein YkwD